MGRDGEPAMLELYGVIFDPVAAQAWGDRLATQACGLATQACGLATQACGLALAFLYDRKGECSERENAKPAPLCTALNTCERGVDPKVADFCQLASDKR